MKRRLVLLLVAIVLCVTTLSPAIATEVWTHVKPAAVGTLDDIIYAVGWTMGYWTEEDMDLRVEVSIGSETKMVAAGKADSCGASPYILLNAIENGIPLLSFYQVDSINFFCFAFHPDKGFKTMEDLKGKTIALGNISWRNIAAANLMAGGVDPDDVEFVVTADSRSQMAWDQKVDAVLTWEKEYQQWEAAGMAFDYIYGWDYLKGPANSWSTTHANLNNEKWVSKAQKAAAGMAKSMYFIHCNPAAATEIGLNYFPALEVPYDIAITAVVAATQVHSGSGHALSSETGYGYHDPQLWDTMQEYCVKAGVITEKLPPEDVYTNLFAQGVTFDRAKIEQQAKDYELSPEHQEIWDKFVDEKINEGVDYPWLDYQKTLRGN